MITLIYLLYSYHKAIQIVWCHRSIQIVIHYGVSKPQSKLMYVLSILSEPSRNLSAPLKVYFSGNTPLINGFSITVQVFTSKPATAICRFGQTKTMPCKLLLSQHQCVNSSLQLCMLFHKRPPYFITPV